MDRETLLQDIADALTDHLDDRDPSVASYDMGEPGPALLLRLSDGSTWVITATEA